MRRFLASKFRALFLLPLAGTVAFAADTLAPKTAHEESAKAPLIPEGFSFARQGIQIETEDIEGKESFVDCTPRMRLASRVYYHTTLNAFREACGLRDAAGKPKLLPQPGLPESEWPVDIGSFRDAANIARLHSPIILNASHSILLSCADLQKNLLQAGQLGEYESKKNRCLKNIEALVPKLPTATALEASDKLFAGATCSAKEAEERKLSKCFTTGAGALGIGESLVGGLFTGKGNCIADFLFGVYRDIAANLEGLKKLAEMGIDKVTSWFKGEDTSADAMHLTSHAGDGLLTKLRKHPLDTLGEMAMSLYDMFMNSLTENFGCEQWAGVPHASQCLKPSGGFACTTCTQRTNMVCGMLGYLGGELVMNGLLTGGLGFTMKAGGFACKATGHVAEMLGKATLEAAEKIAPDITKAAKALAKPVIEGMANGAEAVGAFGSRVAAQASKMSKAVSEQWRFYARTPVLSPLMRPIASVKYLLRKTDIGGKILTVASHPLAPTRWLHEYLSLMEATSKLGFKSGYAFGNELAFHIWEPLSVGQRGEEIAASAKYWKVTPTPDLLWESVGQEWLRYSDRSRYWKEIHAQALEQRAAQARAAADTSHAAPVTPEPDPKPLSRVEQKQIKRDQATRDALVDRQIKDHAVWNELRPEEQDLFKALREKGWNPCD